MLTYIIIGLIVYSVLSRIIKQASTRIKKDYEEYYEQQTDIYEEYPEKENNISSENENSLEDIISEQRNRKQQEKMAPPVIISPELTKINNEGPIADGYYAPIHEYQENIPDIHTEDKKEPKIIELMFQTEDLERGIIMKEIIDKPLFLRSFFKKS